VSPPSETLQGHPEETGQAGAGQFKLCQGKGFSHPGERQIPSSLNAQGQAPHRAEAIAHLHLHRLNLPQGDVHIDAAAEAAAADPGLTAAAVEAVAAPQFNLQGIQATTNPVAVWLIVNGPIAKQLGMNSGLNCLGQGTRANATLGRALHLILQNIGGALPGEMDRATQGQPGKYVFCCAENEEMNPWEPVHVERGFPRDCSAVTVVAASGTLNMNTHSKNAAEVLRVIADTMPHPPSIDYLWSGEPWIMLGPEHAQILKRGGLSKAEVKRGLWEQSKMPANWMATLDLEWTQNSRRAELGEIGP